MHGDTRITMLYVSSLGFDDEIPKSILKKSLETEAPDFMRTLLDLDIPPAQGRLRIPVVATRDKEYIESLSMDALSKFINDHTFPIPGAMIPYSEFYAKFHAVVPDDEKAHWTHKQVTANLPRGNPSGRKGHKNIYFVINLSWTASTNTDGVELIVQNGRIKPKPDIENE